MPTYEYECRACGHRFEARQSFADAALTTCPGCAGTLRRVLHAPLGIHFKGSGFYSTDHRPSGNGAPSEKEEKAPATAKPEAEPPSASNAADSD